MRSEQLRNLFSGATNAQINKIRNQEEIELEYMDFVRNNPGLPISEYELKYSLLNGKKDI